MLLRVEGSAEAEADPRGRRAGDAVPHRLIARGVFRGLAARVGDLRPANYLGSTSHRFWAERRPNSVRHAGSEQMADRLRFFGRKGELHTAHTARGTCPGPQSPRRTCSFAWQIWHSSITRFGSL